MFFYLSDTEFLYVSGNNTREGLSHDGRQLVRFQIPGYVEIVHVLMGRNKRSLKYFRYVQRPVEAVGITSEGTVLLYHFQTVFHVNCHFFWIIDYDPVASCCLFTESALYEGVYGIEVFPAFLGSGENHRYLLVPVFRQHLDRENVQKLFHCPRTSRKYNDGITEAYKGFESFFNVRQNDEIANHGIRRFSRNY